MAPESALGLHSSDLLTRENLLEGERLAENLELLYFQKPLHNTRPGSMAGVLEQGHCFSGDSLLSSVLHLKLASSHLPAWGFPSCTAVLAPYQPTRLLSPSISLRQELQSECSLCLLLLPAWILHWQASLLPSWCLFLDDPKLRKSHSSWLTWK